MDSFSITSLYDITMRDLMHLYKKGYPVIRNSHAGNWSLYKLLLSALGIPDCVWDVTCIHKDVNNQPQVQIIGGDKVTLLKGVVEPENGVKHLTPYQRCDDGQTLSSFHLRPVREMYGDIITTNSEVLLDFEDNLRTVFEVVQRYNPSLIGRYVLPCGCMVTLQSFQGGFHAKCTHQEVFVKSTDLAQSTINTLKELRTLVWDPEGYEPNGGALFSFELVVACFFLYCYWKYGEYPIYMLSGPDMIRYATKEPFVSKVSSAIVLLKSKIPHLVPRTVQAYIVPTAYFRFGYPDGCVIAEEVMWAHDAVWRLQKERRRCLADDVSGHNILTRMLRDYVFLIEDHKETWDLFHDPSQDSFFSQHDLYASSMRMHVMDEYLDVPFSVLGKIVTTLPQIESSLLKQFRLKN